MRKVVIGISVVCLAAGVGGWWFLLRGTSVEVSWGEEWPQTVRGVGEAVEGYEAGTDGEVTGGDRARALERARWKAYYYAQLRLAEQLGQLQIGQETTIRGLELTDQEVRSSFADTIAAATEVEAEGVIEELEDAVRVRVVVEAPQQRIAGLRQTIMSAVRSGRMTIGRSRPEPAPEPEQETTEPEAVQTAAGPESGIGGEATVELAGEGGSPPPARRPQAPQLSFTGCAVLIDEESGMIGVTPDFFDATGAMLGSAFELPAERVAAGIAVATSGETEVVVTWAGENPLRLQATVSRGNIFLHRQLTGQESTFFRRSLRRGRIVLILGENLS